MHLGEAAFKGNDRKVVRTVIPESTFWGGTRLRSVQYCFFEMTWPRNASFHNDLFSKLTQSLMIERIVAIDLRIFRHLTSVSSELRDVGITTRSVVQLSLPNQVFKLR